MTDPNKTSGVGVNNVGNTSSNSLGQNVTQGNLNNQKPNLVFTHPQLEPSTNNLVFSTRPELNSKQANMAKKSFQLQQHLNDLLHQHESSSNSMQSSNQNLPDDKLLNRTITTNNLNSQNLQSFDQNSKVNLPPAKPMVKTRKKTKQTNLIPVLLITTLLVTVATLGYISYYLYNQNQSLQKQVYAQSNNLKQDARLQKLIQTYEQEIANLQQKLNSLEQCHKSTTDST